MPLIGNDFFSKVDLNGALSLEWTCSKIAAGGAILVGVGSKF